MEMGRLSSGVVHVTIISNSRAAWNPNLSSIFMNVSAYFFFFFFLFFQIHLCALWGTEPHVALPEYKHAFCDIYVHES